MQVSRGRLLTRILDASEDEMLALRSLLTRINEDGTQSTLLMQNGESFGYYSGLNDFLRDKCNFDVQIIRDDYAQNELVEVNDKILTGVTLRDYQVAAVRKSLYQRRGINEIATGGGKTASMAAILAQLPEAQALVLVPTGFLMQQHAKNFRGFGLESVGCVGYGRQEWDNRIVIAVVDSAYKACTQENAEWVKNRDVLILDESHHAKAKSWFTVCENCQAPYRLAFTATAFEDPKELQWEDLALISMTGPIIFEIRSKQLRNRGLLADPWVTFIQPASGRLPSFLKAWQAVYRSGIVANKVRNKIIAGIIAACHESDFKSLTFVSQANHGHRLAQAAAQHGCEVVLVQGSQRVSIYKPTGVVQHESWKIEQLADYVNNRQRASIISTQVLDEGVDIPIINVLIMAGGMKKYRRTVQRSGRGMRPKEGENRVYIFDFWDTNHFYLHNQSKYRNWTYEQEEFEFSENVEQTAKLMNIDPSLFQRYQVV